MANLWMKSKYSIAGNLRTNPGDGPFDFHWQEKKLESTVEVIIDPTGKEITSKSHIRVSEELLQALENEISIDKRSVKVNDELDLILGILSGSSRRVLGLIQQESGAFEPEYPEGLYGSIKGGSQWSSDGDNWRSVGDRRLEVAGSFELVQELDRYWQLSIQELIDAGEEPLLAIQHLYEAKRSTGTQFKWIEATANATNNHRILLNNVNHN